MRFWRFLLLAVCVDGSPSSFVLGAAQHVDDFQTGSTTLGWGGGSGPTRIATGGSAGAGDAFLQISAVASANLATFNDTPAWTGDYAAIGATSVTVDLMAPSTSAPLPMRLVLFGPGSTNDRWTSTGAQNVPNDGLWRSYTFDLAEGDLIRVLGAGTHQQLMASVLRAMLRHDPGTPDAGGEGVPSPGGMLNLDNIRLVGIPEPTAAMLGLPAFMAVLSRRRRTC